MTILVAGCSHTYGDDLVNKLDAWPFKLSEMMDTNCISVAKPGGSNELCVYETVKRTSQSKYDLVVIAWTYANRKTFWTTASNHPIDFNIHLVNSQFKKEQSYKDFGKLLYTYWLNDLQSIKIWLQQILQLQSWLKQCHQPYLMLNSTFNQIHEYTSNNWQQLSCFHQMNDDQIIESRAEILKYLDLIDKTNYYELLNFAIDTQDYKVGLTDHALEEGHLDIAKRLYGFICSK